MKALIIQHALHDPPGRFLPLFSERRWQVEVRKAYCQHLETKEVKNYQCLVLLGGPMNVDQEEEYPFLRRVCAVTREALERDIPILGVCLGAQMIAKAAGAKVLRDQAVELGWHKVYLSAEGRKDPLFQGATDAFPVFQWHYDFFEIPQEGKLLAYSESCPHQAIRLGPSYGVQFHAELMAETLELWTKLFSQEMTDCLGDADAAQRILRQTGREIDSYHRLMKQLISNFIDSINAKGPY